MSLTGDLVQKRSPERRDGGGLLAHPQARGFVDEPRVCAPREERG